MSFVGDEDVVLEPADSMEPSVSTGPSADTKTTDEKVDEVTDMFKGLAKKKKTKKATDKKQKATESTDAESKPDEAKPTEEKVEESTEGDMEKGTGIWNHNATQDLKYPQLLERFFRILNDNHPDLMSGTAKSYKIPPPQCLREGNKKTIFANIADICKRMKRSDEHVTSYLFAELGTSGSVDGTRRLVIKGRFQQKVCPSSSDYMQRVQADTGPKKQIENVLRRYIGMYKYTFVDRKKQTLAELTLYLHS